MRGQYQPFKSELSAAQQLILNSHEITVKTQADSESICKAAKFGHFGAQSSKKAVVGN